MKCVTYKNAIRTNPGGAYAHMMTHEVESEVPAVVPSHRRVENRTQAAEGSDGVRSEKRQLKSLGCRLKRVDVVYGSTRKHSGDVENP